MKNYIILTFLFLIVTSFSDKNELPNEFLAKVIGVKDGDTIEVLYKKESIIIRLAHIDCPEKGQPYGQTIKQFMSTLCFSKEVKVISKGKFDRYRRLIAVVEINGKNLNKLLVEKGYAIHFKKYSKDISYAELENTARLNKEGIWSQKKPKNEKKLKNKECKKEVYICNSMASKSYHFFEECTGLQKCKDTLRVICLEKAAKKYGRVLCGYEIVHK